MECDRPVRPRQQAVACDQCERWYHRTCGTGIEQGFYRRLVKNLVTLEWKCSRCESLMLPPPAESTRLSVDQPTEGGNFSLGDSMEEAEGESTMTEGGNFSLGVSLTEASAEGGS